jgi:Zn ribbon nucleic-acid-binding protein
MTTEEFIQKAKAVHGNKYDYSKAEYVNYRTRLLIICPKHGEFLQRPDIHLQGKGCYECGQERRALFHTKSLDQFLQEAKAVHGDKYDYSKVKYLDRQTKVVIVCPKHGKFTQTPTSHIRGAGCPDCGKERDSLRMTTEDFIQKAKAIHGDRYDYSKVEYVDNKKEVCIICREHGEFWQRPKNHLSGYGCPICSGRKKMRTIDFIKRAKQVHGNRYDYSKVEYKGNAEEVCIICPEHGEFWQRAGIHLKGAGCKQCGFIATKAKQTVLTKEKCYELAMQYNDLLMFRTECKTAYSKASRNNWLKDYTWLTRKQLPSNYWNRELIIAEARKYSSSGEFKKGNPQAYSAACNRKLIKEFTWFEKPKNAKKWNYDTCYEEAQKYTTTTDFRANSISAYCKARDNGWLQEYVWLERYVNLYDYDACLAEAKKYQYFNDFRAESHQYYMVARSRGWLREYTWLIREPIEPYNKKWNYDTCYAEAKQYLTRSAFGKGSKGAYKVAHQNGWLADYTWMPDLTASDAKVDSVYCYIFKEQHAAYVGRTLMYRQHIRDLEHGFYSNDSVNKFARKNNCAIPPMQIIEENLTVQEGREREDYWRKHYEAEGFYMLNKAATGAKSGSIGALAQGKWTFEKAYKIAQAFQSVNEMCEEYEYLYRISKARGWLEKFDWFRGEEIRIEKATKWTEETCREEALKYKTRKDFRVNSRGAFDKAQECGWLETYTWLFHHKSHSDWTYESCKEEAAKYPNRNEFGKHAYGAYTVARENGWLDDFYPVPLRRVLDYETCKTLAAQYKSKSELIANDKSLYGTLLKKGWLDEFFKKQ